MSKELAMHPIEFRLEQINCPLCGSESFKVMGIRGNREYFGADPQVTPHVVTNVVQCIRCAFIYTNPLIHGAEDLERRYYSTPEEYQADDPGRVSTMFNDRLDFIQGYVSDAAVSLLDVGAGKGEFLIEAVKRNWEVMGTEPSLKFCEYAKANYQLNILNGYLGLNVKINKQFSVVTLNHVLEHIDDPKSFLTNLKPYLKTEGLLYIEVPNTDSWVLRIADTMFRLKGKQWSSRLSPMHPPFHKYGYTKKSIRFLLNKCGYTLVKLKTFNGKDRGYKYEKRSLTILLRDAVSFLNDWLGNRELLAVIVKKGK